MNAESKLCSIDHRLRKASEWGEGMTKHYKIGIIGVGSIGLRHLHNLVQILKERQVSYAIDLVRSGKGKKLEHEILQYIGHIYAKDDIVPDDYDILFITNPTHMHYDTIRKYASKTKHMFIEKPVFDDARVDISSLGLNAKNVYYVACPLRYTEVIQTLRKICRERQVYSVRAICSSYLPDWRPGKDYRDTYSAHREQGGGVSIDLIHEWDYLCYLFGPPREVFCMRGHFSGLEIDSDDLSIEIARYQAMTVELHLDYFGRKTVRQVELFTDEDTIVGDLANSEIRFLRSGEVISFREERNDLHKKEIEYFFDIIEGRVENENDILTALRTLRIAKEGKIG